MRKTADANALNQLAQALAALAPLLEPREAAAIAATLILAFSKTNGIVEPGQTQSLTALLEGCEPAERSRRAVAVAAVVGTGRPISAVALLGPAVQPLPCRLSTQQLVDLLKLPTCQDPARRVVLAFLEIRYQRPFRNHWEFVAFARERLPDVDLTSPPKRPAR